MTGYRRVCAAVFIFFISASFFFSGRTYAAGGYRNIEATVSRGALNVIRISGGELSEVVGDEAKYELYRSGDWRHLFVKPKAEVGETVRLSLVFVGGGLLDLALKVSEAEPRTLFLEEPRVRAGAEKDSRRRADSMLRSMSQGTVGQYYVTDSPRLLPSVAGLSVRQTKAYRYENLAGAVLSVRNLTREPVTISEADFRGLFKNTIAVGFRTEILEPKAETEVYVVASDAREER